MLDNKINQSIAKQKAEKFESMEARLTELEKLTMLLADNWNNLLTHLGETQGELSSLRADAMAGKHAFGHLYRTSTEFQSSIQALNQMLAEEQARAEAALEDAKKESESEGE